MARWHKSKEERREWWRNLSQEERSAYLARSKARRREKAIEFCAKHPNSKHTRNMKRKFEALNTPKATERTDFSLQEGAPDETPF